MLRTLRDVGAFGGAVALLLLAACGASPPVAEDPPRPEEVPPLEAREIARPEAQPEAQTEAQTEARPLVVDRAEVHHLTSRINQVTYELRVSVPHGYGADDGRRFPVVFTLDPHYSFLIARNITDHMAERGDLPEVVVVGVGYRGQEPGSSPSYRRNRTRDYTPTLVPEGGYGPEIQRLSGGGPEFLEVLETELLPFIDGHYRTQPGARALVGHSYGGLFSVWSLLTRPGLFSGHVAVSPSLWYDGRLALRLEEEFARRHDDLPARLYLCVGAREGSRQRDMVGDLRELARRLEGRSYPNLALASRVLDDETHNSVFPACLSNGLRHVLEGR